MASRLLQLILVGYIAVVSAREATPDGICTTFRVYSVGSDGGAFNDTQVNYRTCHGDRNCQPTCCNGWVQDPSSEEFRCIKAESSRYATLIRKTRDAPEEQTGAPKQPKNSSAPVTNGTAAQDGSAIPEKKPSQDVGSASNNSSVTAAKNDSSSSGGRVDKTPVAGHGQVLNITETSNGTAIDTSKVAASTATIAESSAIPSVTASTLVVTATSKPVSDTTTGVPAPSKASNVTSAPVNTDPPVAPGISTNASSGESHSNNSAAATGQQTGSSAANPAASTSEAIPVSPTEGGKCSGASCPTGDQPGNGTTEDCSDLEQGKNCNMTGPAVQTPNTAVLPSNKLPVVESHSLQQGTISRETATAVTVSLCLVAVIAIVAAVFFWRARRRRRRYFNCSTREPNIQFSNATYDLVSTMERSSLISLEDAADAEDGEANV